MQAPSLTIQALLTPPSVLALGSFTLPGRALPKYQALSHIDILPFS